MRLLTGTSGFAYREWKGSFYPSDLPASAMLAWYGSRFPAVEINASFYRMPSAPVLAQWGAQVPAGFTFVLKATRSIALRRRVEDAAGVVADFFRIASVLGRALGPVLVQLPPNVKKDVARLDAFLALPPAGARLALEFRHRSWLDDDVYATLRAHGAALCVAQSEELDAPPLVPTASWGYLRLRNAAYTDAELDRWAERVRAQPWTEAFAFFKHEDEGSGPRLAARFRERFDATAP
jgi:uncharacterized protein YecE (DUF72 family)